MFLYLTDSNGHHGTMRLADLDVTFWLLPELLDRLAQSSWMFLCKEKRWESGTQLLFAVFVLSFFSSTLEDEKQKMHFDATVWWGHRKAKLKPRVEKKSYRLQVADESTVDALSKRFLSSFLDA